VNDIATNYVLAEIVAGKELTEKSNVELEMGSGVVLRVGVEPEENTTIVPKAIGQGLSTAKSRLWEQGLNVGEVVFDEGIDLLSQKNARVYRQSLGHNTTARLGASVNLWLTLDADKVNESAAASDKVAMKLEEERLREELRQQQEQDSLARASASDVNTIVNVLQQSGAAAASEDSEEDEFFD
jgi:beta-lactam-binding protein with PASTA domain